MNKTQSVTVPLVDPVTLDGKTYTELTFRRMKARDALVGEGEASQVKAGYMLFAALADVPVEVILGLEMDDLTAIGKAVAPLMGKQVEGAVEKALGTPSPGVT